MNIYELQNKDFQKTFPHVCSLCYEHFQSFLIPLAVTEINFTQQSPLYFLIYYFSEHILYIFFKTFLEAFIPFTYVRVWSEKLNICLMDLSMHRHLPTCCLYVLGSLRNIFVVRMTVLNSSKVFRLLCD